MPKFTSFDYSVNQVNGVFSVDKSIFMVEKNTALHRSPLAAIVDGGDGISHASAGARLYPSGGFRSEGGSHAPDSGGAVELSRGDDSVEGADTERR